VTTLLGIALVAAGAALVALGFGRAREPWRRYQALRAQDENAERYRAWRGGPSTAAHEKTGASVAMALLRRRARTWATVAAVGAALVVVGFILLVG
jgi:uncharacterized membrane protein HdeD (DUF308 family)